MRVWLPAVALAVLLTGCTVEVTPTPVPIVTPVVTPPVPVTPPGPPNPVDKACQDFNTLSALIPTIEQLAGTQKLSAQDQGYINDAVALVEAGCQGSSASYQQRVGQVLAELALILQEN